jgi:hypothetical protein
VADEAIPGKTNSRETARSLQAALGPRRWEDPIAVGRPVDRLTSAANPVATRAVRAVAVMAAVMVGVMVGVTVGGTLVVAVVVVAGTLVVAAGTATVVGLIDATIGVMTIDESTVTTEKTGGMTDTAGGMGGMGGTTAGVTIATDTIETDADSVLVLFLFSHSAQPTTLPPITDCQWKPIKGDRDLSKKLFCLPWCDRWARELGLASTALSVGSMLRGGNNMADAKENIVKMEAATTVVVSEPATSSRTTPIVLTYMLFSSTMLITNKAAILSFPLPSTLLLLQMIASSAVIWLLGYRGFFEGLTV